MNRTTVRSAPARVASGRPYHVKACRGRVPSTLADFEGGTEFAVSTGTGTTVVRGVGAAEEDWVRFSEKNVTGDEDVRVWHIVQEADGGFTAATGPAAVLGWPLAWPPV